MKNLNDYTSFKIDKILEDNGAFFDFSKSQFDKQKTEGTVYVQTEAGLLCPKDKAEQCLKAIDDCYEQAIQQRLSDYTKEEIIEYELGNYECYYTGDITNALDVLSNYKITPEEVLEVYQKTKSKHYED